MQPNPRAETFGPVFPKWRYFMSSPENSRIALRLIQMLKKGAKRRRMAQLFEPLIVQNLFDWRERIRGGCLLDVLHGKIKVICQRVETGEIIIGLRAAE